MCGNVSSASASFDPLNFPGVSDSNNQNVIRLVCAAELEMFTVYYAAATKCRKAEQQNSRTTSMIVSSLHHNKIYC